MGAVGGEEGVGGPSVALRDGDLGYELKSQADLVIRVPMGGGTHVGRERGASTPEVARTSGDGGVPLHRRSHARRETAGRHYTAGRAHVARGRGSSTP